MATLIDRRERSPAEATLAQLCGMVVAMKHPFEDVADFIEDRAYEACDHGKFDPVMRQLKRMAGFFERMENKNEENCRDLGDVYMLIGEIHQCCEKFAESVEWFRNAAVVNDRYEAPYHAMALSYRRMKDYVQAAKSLEQEIILAPGNYYSYLLLADIYEAQGLHDKARNTLDRLLERDPQNVQALHRIIAFYEHKNPELDVELLRRRLTAVKRPLNEVELVIWAYHMHRMKRHAEALRFLESREGDTPEVSIVHLLKAFMYGEMKQFTRKRNELSRFKSKNDGNEAFLQSKLKEFGDIFGEQAVARLNKRLIVSRHHHGSRNGGGPRERAG